MKLSKFNKIIIVGFVAVFCTFIGMDLVKEDKVSNSNVINYSEKKSSALEKVIKEGLDSYSKRIDLRDFNFKFSNDKEQNEIMSYIRDIYHDFGLNNPEYFYITTKSTITFSSGQINSIMPDYSFVVNISNIEKMNKKRVHFNEVATTIADYAKLQSTDYKKAMAVHDYLVMNSRYDEKYSGSLTKPTYTYRADGILLDGLGLCQSYASAYHYIMNKKLGISTKYAITSNHIWNLVKVGGVYYNVDVSTDSVEAEKYNKSTRYTYFMVSKAKLEKLWGPAEYDVKAATYDYGKKPVKVTKPKKVSLYSIKRYKNPRKEVLKWKKVSGATGYQVRAYRKGFKGYRTFKYTKKTSYTKTKSKSGYKYRYKVRAYKTVNGKRYYGPFSKTKYIRPY